jgi:hypothetical protein
MRAVRIPVGPDAEGSLGNCTNERVDAPPREAVRWPPHGDHRAWRALAAQPLEYGIEPGPNIFAHDEHDPLVAQEKPEKAESVRFAHDKRALALHLPHFGRAS